MAYQHLARYRHIASATQSGERVSGHHYINEQRPEQQFMIDIHWETMTVHVRELVRDSEVTASKTEWRTVSVTPLNATSPAR